MKHWPCGGISQRAPIRQEVFRPVRPMAFSSSVRNRESSPESYPRRLQISRSSHSIVVWHTSFCAMPSPLVINATFGTLGLVVLEGMRRWSQRFARLRRSACSTAAPSVPGRTTTRDPAEFSDMRVDKRALASAVAAHFFASADWPASMPFAQKGTPRVVANSGSRSRALNRYSQDYLKKLRQVGLLHRILMMQSSPALAWTRTCRILEAES